MKKSALISQLAVVVLRGSIAKIPARLLVALTVFGVIVFTATSARAALESPSDADLTADPIAHSFALADAAPAEPAPSTAPALASAAAPAQTSGLFKLAPVDRARPTSIASRRPAALLPLYTSFAALQIMDVRSTLTAFDNGASEANPMFTGIRSPASMLALKAGITAGTIYAVERLRKRNPKTAVVLMFVLNSAYATVVAHNYSVAQQ